MTDKIMRILQLPKTLVIGNYTKLYNDYTLFLPFREHICYTHILITELSYFEKRRLLLRVPASPAEEYLCRMLMQRNKSVFALQHAAIPGTAIIPDSTTRLITQSMVQNYPFGTMFIPSKAILTPLAAEEKITFKEFKPCESEKYMEVFGQPKKQKS